MYIYIYKNYIYQYKNYIYIYIFQRTRTVGLCGNMNGSMLDYARSVSLH
jgi:hypothetical protein